MGNLGRNSGQLGAEPIPPVDGWYAPKDVKSRLRGPISSLGFLERSLLFAELATIAYLPARSAEQCIERIGFESLHFFDRDGAQAYAFQHPHDCVVACRGTEPTEWNDIRADLYALLAVAETVGRVHRGFKREVDDLWPQIEAFIKDSTQAVWFTGHSLGGAMATICAGRCLLAHIEAIPSAIYTYGSPRVGNRRYINYCEIEHARWVNNNDVVTRVPPTWMGYRHRGDEFYFDYYGELKRMTAWQRFKDRSRGFLYGLLRGRIDHFADHSMLDYINYLSHAMQQERRGALRRPVLKLIAKHQRDH